MRRGLLASLLLACAAPVLVAVPAQAFSSPLDSSFGHGGAAVDFYDDDDYGPISALVRQPDGHLVVLGYEADGPLHAWRYSRVGRPAGAVPVRSNVLGAGDAQPAGGIALSDGSIAMTGSTRSERGGYGGLSVARLNANLTYDGRFGSNGLVTFPTTYPLIDGRAIVADGDKLIVGGLARRGDELLLGVARFNADGSVDQTFGTAGLVTFSPPGAEDKVSAHHGPGEDYRVGLTSVDGLRVQPDHRILVAGSVRDRASGAARVVAARLLPSGGLDPSYGDARSGTATFAFGQEPCGRGCQRPVRSQANAAIVQGEKLVIAGSAGPDFDFYHQAQFALARMTSDGHLDSTFGRNGITRVDFGGSSGALTLVAQRDGGLIAGGGTDSSFALARLRANGRPDTRYGTVGRACDELPGPGPQRMSAEASGLVAEPDGRVVAAGGAQDAGSSLVVLARFKRRYRTPMGCISVSPYVLPRNIRHISGVIAHRSHIKIRVSRDSADGKRPAKTIGFVDFGWHAAGAFSIRWHLRVHGRRLRSLIYAVRLYATDRHGHTLQYETTGADLE